MTDTEDSVYKKKIQQILMENLTLPGFTLFKYFNIKQKTSSAEMVDFTTFVSMKQMLDLIFKNYLKKNSKFFGETPENHQNLKIALKNVNSVLKFFFSFFKK